MAGQINFGILQNQSNPLEQFVGGLQAGDQDRMRRQQMQLAQQELEQRRIAQERELAGNDAVASFFESMAGGAPQMPTSAPAVAAPPQPAAAPQMPAMAPQQPPQPDMAAPQAAPAMQQMGAQPGDEPMLTVEASREERPNPMQFLAQIARSGQGQLAMQLWEKSRSMEDAERKRVVETYDAMAAATAGLEKLPYEQRRATLAQMAPALVERGIPAELIQRFDPTDAALMAARNQALGMKGVFDVANQEATRELQQARFAEDVRANQTREALTVRGQNMTDARSRENTAVAAMGVDRNTRRTETDLRKEFETRPEVKEWREISSNYRQIKSQLQRPNPTAQNDIAAIFSYMKMLDPGSVVREGEFANAQNAAGIPDQVRNLYNRAISGERLNPQQRANMIESAAGVVVARRDRYNNLAGQYRSYAADYGGNPDRVARPVAVLERGQRQAASNAPPPPRVGQVVNGWRFNGGDPARRTNWTRAN